MSVSQHFPNFHKMQIWTKKNVQAQKHEDEENNFQSQNGT